MASEKTVDQIKSWMGILLMLLPVLRLLPIPWLQGVLQAIPDSFLGTMGAGGMALSATSGKAVGKNVA